MTALSTTPTHWARLWPTASKRWNHPLVDHVRGRGLLRGIVLTAPQGKAVEVAARESGFLVNAAAPDVVRLAPLIITEKQVDGFLSALPGILDEGAAS